jgi:hypothetical protein
MTKQALSFLILPLAIATLLAGCSHPSKKTLFTELSSSNTGVQFVNTVTQSGENNVLVYPYFFNGGGVAIGDINNDGLADIYFTGNQVPNKLYLNTGNFSFKEITAEAGVTANEGWKTGCTMADVNNDGWLDIYVCRSAMGDSSMRKNLLFINNGNLTFTERAEQFGIADNSYSTQAAFFDFDKDNDLDLFVLNHSLPQYGGFSKVMGNLKNKKGKKFGSKLYRNNNGKFEDISAQAGIINNVLSFGLGVAVSDVNLDGWPDMYISNDFNEEDYLYINNQDGTFKNVIAQATGHVSLFSMGSDVADINNDALPDIFTSDMLPETNDRIKLSSGDDNYDKYKLLIDQGFHHQSMRNMLQLNNGNGTFSEIGQLAGISNTDWSWTPLFADFDGDGWKDLFITNGYEKDYTNMQFLKFTVDEQIKARTTGTSPDMKLILDRMPSIDVGNYLYRNNGNLTFTKTTAEWGMTKKIKSNGAAYADLDNDGDPDLVVNVMNGESVLFENTAGDKTNFLKVDLSQAKGAGIIEGTKIYTWCSGKSQYHEFSPARGFQSTMFAPITVGVDTSAVVDSIRIVWPDNKTRLYEHVSIKKVFAPNRAEATDQFVYLQVKRPLFEDSDLVQWQHTATDTNDFKRQFLLPKMYSRSGPHMAKADINADGLTDLYICGGYGQPAALFVQTRAGAMLQTSVPAFNKDKFYDDEDAAFFDADNDGDQDLYVVSGGYYLSKDSELLQDRLYLNNGKGSFTRSLRALPRENLSGACVAIIDVDADKDFDLFVGSRVTPGEYPEAPQSLFLLNNGKGVFTDATQQIAPALKNLGMICDAVTTDINRDSLPDLIVCGEWLPITIMVNKNGRLEKDSTWFSSPVDGWWNCLAAEDFDNDGDIDLIAGNYGLNNQFKPTDHNPVTLTYKDFNNDGHVDPFFCYYICGQSYPYASRDEALGQVSFLKTRFTDYNAYAGATMENLFTPAELKDARSMRASTLATMYFENTGQLLKSKKLPVESQFSSVHAIEVFDVDEDGDKDLILVGNDTYQRVRMGKMDANRGTVFLNDGRGSFGYLPQYRSGLNIPDDTRSLMTLRTLNGSFLIAGVNGKSVICKYHNATRTGHHP